MSKKISVAQQINDMVKEVVTSPGYRTVRNDTARRDGTKGFGWYTTVDTAYEGMSTVFFKNFNEAREWYASSKS